jgi:hypothetical protein
LTNYKKIYFPKISDPRGNLSFVQFPNQIPFEIKRVFWTYNVPSGEIRGGHAFKTQEEVIVALSGSFDVVITNESGEQESVNLNKCNEGLYLPPNTWRHLENFSTNAVSLHISNIVFSVDDYIRDIKVLYSAV